MRLSRDGWVGLAVLAGSLALFALTLDLKQSDLVPIGPGFYPRIILGLTGVLSLWLVFSDLWGKQPPGTEQSVNYGLVAATFAIFGLYVGALPLLGFRISTLLFVAALQVTLEPPKDRKGWIAVAVTALLTVVVSYIVFERYLQVLLPRGKWTDF